MHTLYSSLIVACPLGKSFFISLLCQPIMYIMITASHIFQISLFFLLICHCSQPYVCNIFLSSLSQNHVLRTFVHCTNNYTSFHNTLIVFLSYHSSRTYISNNFSPYSLQKKKDLLETRLVIGISVHIFPKLWS